MYAKSFVPSDDIYAGQCVADGPMRDAIAPVNSPIDLQINSFDVFHNPILSGGASFQVHVSSMNFTFI